MYKRHRFNFFTLFILILFFSLNLSVRADSNGLVLEWEQHWETFGVGGTCNYGTHNFFVGDVDSDGFLEMITGGFMYYMENDTRITAEAPLRIWNWNGENFTLEAGHNWDGSISSIYADDLESDGLVEMIIGGHVTNSTSSFSTLRIWNYDGGILGLKDSYECEGRTFSSIFASDLDKDGRSEILTAGRITYDTQSFAQLSLWQWDGMDLTLLESTEWCAKNEAYAYSVHASDLNKDGIIEIITGGYDNDLTNSSGQLRIWHWKEGELVLETNEEWRLVEGVYGETISGLPMGNTVVNNLKVADIDKDGTPEIVTGGWTYDGKKSKAQLRIWNYNGQILSLEKSHEWTTEDITEIKAISLGDVDEEEDVEIVTSGLTSVYGSFKNVESTPDAAQLRIWSWNGDTLRLKQSKDWTIGEGVVAWNVGIGDVDGDDTVEIVTVGCMAEFNLCDPDLRIWSIAEESNNISLPFLVALVLSVIVGLVIGILIFIRNRFHF